MFISKKKIREFINRQNDVINDYRIFYNCKNEEEKIKKNTFIDAYNEIIEKIERQLLK
jgi:hypothetical protein